MQLDLNRCISKFGPPSIVWVFFCFVLRLIKNHQKKCQLLQGKLLQADTCINTFISYF